MYNKDVIDLYDRVPTGTRVTVTWNRYTTSAAPTASWGGGSGVVDRTAARGPSGASSGFVFPWFDQEEPAPRRAEQTKQRAQQKRPPVRSGNAPKKQEQTTPVSSNAVAPQQSVSVY
jgi:lipoprotein-anchoring transpeptidase ErfK/SrfK